MLKPFLIHLYFLALNVVLIPPIGAAGVKGKMNRGKTHPKDMGKHEVERFLSHLAEKKNVAAATQKQALYALIFLYKRVLDIDLGNDIAPMRSKPRKNLPTVFTKEEVSNMRPLKNVQFCSSSRKTKILTPGIHGVF